MAKKTTGKKTAKKSGKTSSGKKATKKSAKKTAKKATSSGMSRSMKKSSKKAAKKTTKKSAKKSTRRGASKRELIDTGTDKRYVRRDAEGQFKESDDVGRSLAADVRQHASTPAEPGQGDRGD